MDIPSPNLRILLHYFHSAEHLFVTATMYADARRERALEEMARTHAWFGGRFSAAHRHGYMQVRVLVETLMCREFAEKYAAPRSTSPVFFYLRPRLSLSSIQDGLRRRQDLGEHATQYLLIDLDDIDDTSQVSFTVHDSHRSYRRAIAEAGFEAHPTGGDSPDDGRVFHVSEIADVYARHRDEDDLSFEVQFWDPAVLRPWLRARAERRGVARRSRVTPDDGGTE
jgi:hypothetical protein